jgi:hypothetical protein
MLPSLLAQTHAGDVEIHQQLLILLEDVFRKLGCDTHDRFVVLRLVSGLESSPNSFGQRWSRKFGQRDKWSYCLMAGTLCPLDQERP